MASQRIKGITIEIGGDTSELAKSLYAVDKTIKETQSNLRDVNSALKFDTGNVALLQTKQELLNERVDEAKKKLEAEKTALDQLKNSDGFDENSKAAKDLQTQIALDEVELQKAEDAVKSFGSVGKQQLQLVANKVKSVGDNLKSIGANLTKAVTVPIVGLAAASVSAWQEVDSAMDIVAQKTGASGEALAEMQESVTAIAESIPTSFEEAGTAIGEVNTRFGLTGDALEELSTKFIEFADLNGTDVNSSIDTVQQALNAFGLGAEDAGAMLDTMNKVGQDTGISMDTLGQLLVSNATAFQGLGLNAADAATLLGTLEKSGIDTSVVMTGLSKVQKQAIEDGVSMEEALTTALNDSATAIDVFGTKAGPKLYESFENGVLSVDDFVNSTVGLNDALGSVSDTYTATLDPLDQMTMTMNTLKQTGADIVNSAAPMLTQAMQAIADVVKRLSDAWNGLTPAQQEVAIKLAAIVAVIPPVITAIGGIVSTVSTLIPLISAIGPYVTGTIIPAITAISAPVMGVVAAVAAVIAIIAVCVTHWEEIKEVASTVADVLAQKWDEFKTKVTNAWTSVMNSINTIVTNIKTTVTTAWNILISTVTTKITTFKNNAVNTFNNLKNSIASVIGNIKNTIVSGFQNAVSYITSLPGRAIGWGRDIINGIVDGIRNAFGNLVSAVSDIADTIASYIHFSEPDKGALSNFHTYMPDMMRQIAQGIENGIPKVESAMSNLTTSMSPSMGGTTNNMSNAITLNVYGAQGQDVNELADAIQDRINAQIYRNGAAFA